MKPLKRKAYGSIGHLPNSRIGPGDHHCHEGQARYFTEKRRDKNTVIVVQEKLDGSNVAVCKLHGEIIPLVKAGYIANTSKWEQHQIFHKWVIQNYERFDALLNEGERCCGEWLIQPHSTLYDFPHEPFVIFDIMTEDIRELSEYVKKRCEAQGFIAPYEIHRGDPISVDDALKIIGKFGHHGALEQVEGIVYRMESRGQVQCLAKYVRPDKIDGKYFEQDMPFNKVNGKVFRLYQRK